MGNVLSNSLIWFSFSSLSFRPSIFTSFIKVIAVGDSDSWTSFCWCLYQSSSRNNFCLCHHSSSPIAFLSPFLINSYVWCESPIYMFIRVIWIWIAFELITRISNDVFFLSFSFGMRLIHCCYGFFFVVHSIDAVLFYSFWSRFWFDIGNKFCLISNCRAYWATNIMRNQWAIVSVNYTQMNKNCTALVEKLFSVFFLSHHEKLKLYYLMIGVIWYSFS